MKHFAEIAETLSGTLAFSISLFDLETEDLNTEYENK